ncbi:General odorant-binding protein 56a [Frankliniella fusca]|uniref:General odorant-binding protein 56a n=1 Tax=Frankliniella fusca TaxID=407009 RepID=A0AAE1HBQ1_9NEOP|nr:General odorant-binding protein 56a [Frankliniella fusca]
MRARPAPALSVLLILAAALLAPPARGTEEEDEEAILASLKECSEKVQPTEDDLTEVSKGDLKSLNAKTVITCWFMGAGVMRDKMFQKDRAITFLRALTPGDPKNDNVKLMSKLTEKCDASVNTQSMSDKSDMEAAVIIYDCLVREGRALRLSLDEGNGQGNATAAAQTA